MEESMPKHTIGIAVYDGSAFLDANLKGLEKAQTDYEVFVTETKYPRISLAQGWNESIRKGTGEFVHVYNDDCLPSEGVFDKLTDVLEAHPNIGVVSCSLSVCANNQKQPFEEFKIPNKDYANYSMADVQNVADAIEKKYAGKIIKMPMICGCVHSMRREFFEQLGGYCEQFFPMYGEDDDFCDRVYEAGKSCAWVVYAFVHHIGRQTMGRLPDLDRNYINRVLKRRREERKLKTG